jgi:hypothetical protein
VITPDMSDKKRKESLERKWVENQHTCQDCMHQNLGE